MNPVDSGEPLISVIMPAYQAERFLPHSLDSLRAQTEGRWECIVVDDGSSDATGAIAKRYASLDRRVRLVRQSNGGASAARNAGYRVSNRSSRYVTFMDSDDIYLPMALASLLTKAEADPASIGSHGLAELIDERGERVSAGQYAARGRHRLGLEDGRLRVWPLDRPTDFRVLVNGNVLFPPGLVLVERQAYDAAGPFDENFKGAEDWDMLIRLSRLGHIAFLDDVILLYRRHNSNLGAQPGIEKQAWEVRCKAFHSPENSPMQKRVARAGWRAYQRDMALQRFRAAGRALSQRRLATAARETARAGTSLGRYVRGYPLPRLVRGSPGW